MEPIQCKWILHDVKTKDCTQSLSNQFTGRFTFSNYGLASREELAGPHGLPLMNGNKTWRKVLTMKENQLEISRNNLPLDQNAKGCCVVSDYLDLLMATSFCTAWPWMSARAFSGLSVMTSWMVLRIETTVSPSRFLAGCCWPHGRLPTKSRSA